MSRSGYDIAHSVDPNTSNDVCTFCVHGQGGGSICALGFPSYFRSLSNLGAIWVSDCGKGEPKPQYKTSAA